MIWDASDANPLHRRLPAEVVSRRAYVKKPPPEEKALEDQVIVDIKAASLLKPEARLKWLAKACKMVTDGRSTATDLYDVIVNRKFTSGMPERLRRKLTGIIKENLEAFSDKQQRYLLSTDSPLLTSDRDREVDDAVAGDEEPEAEAEAIGTAAVSSDRGSAAAPEAKGPSTTATTSTGSAPSATRPAPAPSAALPFIQADLKAAKALSSSRAATPSGQTREERLPPGGGWQTVEDDTTRRRQMAAQDGRRDPDKRGRRPADEEDNVLSRAAADEAAAAAKKKKIEEEADDIFARIKIPGASDPPAGASGRSRKGGERDRRRRRASSAPSRSRSISSREARKVKASERQSRRSWQENTPIPALTGSRALLLNKDYQEDLPHLPRPTDLRGAGSRVVHQARAQQGEASRSRSRGKRRSKLLALTS
mmetsp:Transcript_20956/g.38255  ORF Transcript_20956/g.38255 Transcript_20956/m.38255 type:complete len:424 (-) Transcript_20956:52-1323(-)